MPRLARLDAPGVLHHVMGRGIEGNDIFRNDTDRQDFVDRLSTLAIKGAWDVYAWTLMPNHFHVDYVKKGLSLGRRPELVGGGLIRSLGGWSAVLAIRKRGEKHAYDQRMLGDSEFVQEIRTDLNDLIKRKLRLSGQRIDLEVLAEKVCKLYQSSMTELQSGSRRKAVTKARRAISWIGVREFGYTGAEIARYLGVTNSCVTRVASSESRPEIDNLLDSLNTLSTNVP